MSFLQVQQLEKRYPGATIFEGVNFTMERGEFVCIIGHSGCGKTTILNVLAGLDAASSGTVIMDNREVAGPSLDRGVVFQGHALMPWLSAMATSPSRSGAAGRTGTASRCSCIARNSSTWSA